MAKYLTVGLDSGKAELFQEAFGDMVEKHGGLKVIAKKVKVSVRFLKETLADRETFQVWIDMAKIVKALSGKRLEFKADQIRPNKH